MGERKHEWRKAEKEIYQPPRSPQILTVPAFSYIVLSGQGDPNGPHFSSCIEALYSLAYAIKMNLKKQENPPPGYQDWTVYPLTGIWDLTEEEKQKQPTVLNKDALVFDLMIRQPDFVDLEFVEAMLELTKKKKPNPLLEEIQFKTITDGKCIQMMHVGSFDDEPASFAEMEAFAKTHKLRRKAKTHREIYLSDFRKVPAEKLKTILRFQVD